jgi:hypothetical protein
MSDERAPDAGTAGEDSGLTIGRRRALTLAAAAGAVGAASLIAAETASANTGNSEGQALLLGDANTATSSTVVTTTAGYGLEGYIGASGIDASALPETAGVLGVDNSNGSTSSTALANAGVVGVSTNGYGVLGSIGAQDVSPPSFLDQAGMVGVDTSGYSGNCGVVGISAGGYGVYAVGAVAVEAPGVLAGVIASATDPASGVGVNGQGPAAGVTGTATAANGIGVGGFGGASGAGVTGSGGGYGVDGLSEDGVGVRARSPKGKALEVEGVASFSRSGLAKISAHKSSIKVTNAPVTAASLILATVQGSPASGVYIKGVVKSGKDFTIELSKATKSALPIAWFVIG